MSPVRRTSCWHPQGERVAQTVEHVTFNHGVVGSIPTALTREISEIKRLFAVVLVLQSLPFLSAVAIAILESSRINSFTFWRDTGIRTAELIGLRPVAMPTVAGQSQPVGSEVRREAS